MSGRIVCAVVGLGLTALAFYAVHRGANGYDVLGLAFTAGSIVEMAREP